MLTTTFVSAEPPPNLTQILTVPFASYTYSVMIPYTLSISLPIPGPCLHESGLVPKKLTYREDAEALDYGIGLTNIVPRTTRGANELSRYNTQTNFFPLVFMSSLGFHMGGRGARGGTSLRNQTTELGSHCLFPGRVAYDWKRWLVGRGLY